LDLKHPVLTCPNQSDKLYQLFQSYATCPPEVYIAPAKSALLWEISSVDSSDEEVKENTTTILLNVNDEDEIYSVQVDPTDTAIKEFTKSDSTITKKSAARTARISASEDEEEAAPVPKAKRKADTKEPEEKVSKRTKVAGQKQAEKAIVESTEKEAPKKGRSRSRSASIVEEKDDSNITPSTKAAASRKKRKDSIAESIASEGTQTSKKIKKQFDLERLKKAQAEEEDIESMDSVELERKSSSKKKNPKKMTITKETDDAKEKGDTIKTPTKAATIKATEGEEEKSDTTKKINQPTKKNKDPNAPKRPPTTYLLFCKEYRQKVVQENPGKTTQEIGMILGATYKKLKTEARAKYQKDADKLKQQFLKDVENYEKNKVEGGSDSGDKSDEEEEAPETVKRKKRAKKDPLASEEIHEKNEVEGGSDSGDKSDEEEKAPETVKRKKIAKKDPLAPKKALSSYMFFCSSKRPELKKAQPKLTVPEMAKLMGKMWQDATDATKVPFDVMAKKDKERYKSEMETFKSSS